LALDGAIQLQTARVVQAAEPGVRGPLKMSNYRRVKTKGACYFFTSFSELGITMDLAGGELIYLCRYTEVGRKAFFDSYQESTTPEGGFHFRM
jgi:hypothetical protein